MTFEEVWQREYLLLGGTANKAAARRLWDAAVAEYKKRDAKIAQHMKPQGEVVISWGMQETRPCDCPLVIATAIREQP